MGVTTRPTVPRLGRRARPAHKKSKMSVSSASQPLPATHLHLRQTIDYLLDFIFHVGGRSKKQHRPYQHRRPDDNNIMGDYEPSDAPFFRLPLEIREMIYHYALLPPEVYPHIMADDPSTVVVHYKKRNSHDRKYWGTEAMSRLLRVNRQIYQEASAVLYKAFPFTFPHYCSVDTVRRFSEPLNLVCRSSIRSISLIAILRLAGLPKSNATSQWLDAFTLLARSLPGLRFVNLELAFIGLDVENCKETEIVDTALDLARPFRAVEHLILSNHDPPGTQRANIFTTCQNKVVAGGYW